MECFRNYPALRAHSPRSKHLSQIEGVHDVVPVEVGGTALARPPGTQHESQIGSTDNAVTVKVLRTLGLALVQEQTLRPFGIVNERVAVVLKPMLGCRTSVLARRQFLGLSHVGLGVAAVTNLVLQSHQPFQQ